ncbi:GMC oxidoreductase [Prochlorococcus marinus]|uniref:Glucose-methanol-choline (GMC) oxidoreductase:NAD binding site n=1 Tax=Prochlorococcus marinus (strain MIT 9211) TaxID=93059 RepID=A9BA28_PROM4|nr:GMC family oxidoreductase [Prochlorococcus marinus]ABX08690.1 Glucose-methanol-choline (GMC) oxidoreductase:NAD binding site [Prochlorococcus marinus str. MIT 9211]
MTNTYEAIVIGSGATGGVASLTLAKAGVRVLLVEAGPLLTAKQALGTEPLNTFKRLLSIFNGNHRKQIQHPGYWKANPSLYINEKENPYIYPKEKPFIWTQGRQVGGRSLTWGGITLRLSNSDLKAATKDGYGPEWPISYSDLEPHYNILERFFKVHGCNDGLTQLPDGYFIKNLPFTNSESLFASEVKRKLGYPIIHSRGFGPHAHVNDEEWPRSSSPGSTLKVALATGKVNLLPEHIAETLIINKSNSIAEGIIVIDKETGARKELKSKLIVLCGSTIQSLRLLLNSQEKYNNKRLIDLSESLGCNLMDHISTCRFFAMPTKTESKDSKFLTAQKLSGAGSFFIPFGNKLDSTDDVDFRRGYGIWGAIDRFEPPGILKRKPNSKIGFLIGHGEVLPYKENKVTLSTQLDKWGVPIPSIECEWKTNEIKMVAHMNKTIQKCISAAGGEILPLKELIKMPFVEPIINSAMAIQDKAPPPGYYIHEVGGAPMGYCPESSVLDPLNRLWACPNVLVVDGSCWPTSSWQSPTLTMMAISRRACLGAIKNQRA